MVGGFTSEILQHLHQRLDQGLHLYLRPVKTSPRHFLSTRADSLGMVSTIKARKTRSLAHKPAAKIQLAGPGNSQLSWAAGWAFRMAKEMIRVGRAELATPLYPPAPQALPRIRLPISLSIQQLPKLITTTASGGSLTCLMTTLLSRRIMRMSRATKARVDQKVELASHTFHGMCLITESISICQRIGKAMPCGFTSKEFFGLPRCGSTGSHSANTPHTKATVGTHAHFCCRLFVVYPPRIDRGE